MTKNNAGTESDTRDDLKGKDDEKDRGGKGRLIEEQDVTWRGSEGGGAASSGADSSA